MRLAGGGHLVGLVVLESFGGHIVADPGAAQGTNQGAGKGRGQATTANCRAADCTAQQCTPVTTTLDRVGLGGLIGKHALLKGAQFVGLIRLNVPATPGVSKRVRPTWEYSAGKSRP